MATFKNELRHATLGALLDHLETLKIDRANAVIPPETTDSPSSGLVDEGYTAEIARVQELLAEFTGYVRPPRALFRKV